MTAAAIAASSARETVLVIPLYPCILGLHSGKRLSEGGIHLIRSLALLHSFGGCHQCRSNPTNLLLYELVLAGAVLGCLVDITIMRLVSAYQGTCFIWAFWGLRVVIG